MLSCILVILSSSSSTTLTSPTVSKFSFGKDEKSNWVTLKVEAKKTMGPKINSANKFLKLKKINLKLKTK